MSIRIFTLLYFTLFPYLTTTQYVQLYSCYADDSTPQFCNPYETSLSYRQSITATSTCGLNETTEFAVRTPAGVTDGYYCGPNEPNSHPPSYLTDFVMESATWWQSDNAIYTPQTVNLTLSLERLTEATLISITFQSYNPESLYLERSIDFGVSYQAYHYFSSNCFGKYGIDHNAPIVTDGQVTCEDISSKNSPDILVS